MRKRTVALGAVCALVGMCTVAYIADEEGRARYAAERPARDSARAAKRAEQVRRDSLERVEREMRDAPLDGAVEIRDGQVRVTNLEDRSWARCEVALNPGIVKSGWTAEVAGIAPGQTVAGGLLTFTRSDGERFNPITHAVQSIGVTCDTQYGRRIGRWSAR